MRLLTWNIGSFITRRYITWGLQNLEQLEYFQPSLNSEFVTNTINHLQPDFIFLQEFYNKQDAEEISALKDYPFKKPLDMWYGKGRALIASKVPFKINTKNNIFYISLESFTIIPIHLNAYSTKHRLQEVEKIKTTFIDHINIILFGDFNIWNKKEFFIFRNDFKSSLLLKSFLRDLSQNISSTTFLGFSLDKVFTSANVVCKNKPSSPTWRGSYMDHYPLYFDIDVNEITLTTLEKEKK